MIDQFKEAHILRKRANEGNRTPDRTLTKRLLYRLSYVGVGAIIPEYFCSRTFRRYLDIANI